MCAMYDLRCVKCEHDQTFLINIREYDPNNLPVCEECGEPTERVIQKTHMALLGTGWARDGYTK